MPLGDFTDQANSYAQSRPGYPGPFLRELFALADCHPGDPVVDLGAGTGILTQYLVDAGFQVTAVEPNAAMRHWGQDIPARWVDGTFDSTHLEPSPKMGPGRPIVSLGRTPIRSIGNQPDFAATWPFHDPVERKRSHPLPSFGLDLRAVERPGTRVFRRVPPPGLGRGFGLNGHFGSVRQSSFSHRFRCHPIDIFLSGKAIIGLPPLRVTDQEPLFGGIGIRVGPGPFHRSRHFVSVHRLDGSKTQLRPPGKPTFDFP